MQRSRTILETPEWPRHANVVKDEVYAFGLGFNCVKDGLAAKARETAFPRCLKVYGS